MGEDSASISPAGGAATAEEGVLEWELGLPSAEDLTPLSQTLIPPELASAFSISPEPFHSLLDVHRASHNTVSTLRRLNSYPPAASDRPIPVEDRLSDESDSSTVRSDNLADDPSSRASKRRRLVWTPHLHKRFVDVVSHLGIKNAVPKTIMQLMNVEGLTRENVASHLQKYRLHLKRSQGLSIEGPSSSDPLFETAPAPPEPSYAVPPPMIPMPVLGVANREGSWSYHGNEFHQPYGGFGSIPMFPSFLPNGPELSKY